MLLHVLARVCDQMLLCILELLALGAYRVRSMFGGLGSFVDRVMRTACDAVDSWPRSLGCLVYRVMRTALRLLDPALQCTITIRMARRELF